MFKYKEGFSHTQRILQLFLNQNRWKFFPPKHGGKLYEIKFFSEQYICD